MSKTKMRGINYTKKEVKVLIDNQDMSLAELSKRLGRTVNSVRGKRFSLKIGQLNLWSDREINLLKKHKDLTDKELQRRFLKNRTIKSLSQKRLHIGQVKFSHHRFTDKDYKLIKNLHAKGFNDKQIAKKLNVEPSIVPHHRLNVLGIRTLKRYRYNEDFFKAWTPKMAYILGFIFADGSLAISSGKNNLSFKIQIGDIEIIEAIRKCICPDKPLYNRKARPPGRKNQIGIDITNETICSDLVKLGVPIGSKKTYTMTLPDVPEDMFNHFVRGYFDGDGNLNIQKHKSKITNINWNTSCVSHDWNQQLLEMIKKYLDVNGYLSKDNKKSKGIYFTGINALILLEWMYKRKHLSIYLNRKYQKYVSLKDEYKRLKQGKKEYDSQTKTIIKYYGFIIQKQLAEKVSMSVSGLEKRVSRLKKDNAFTKEQIELSTIHNRRIMLKHRKLKTANIKEVCKNNDRSIIGKNQHFC